MRKVFLEELPKKGNRINWKESIGYKVPFVYDDIEGEVCILSRQKEALIIEYKNREYKIFTGEFRKCQFGKITGKICGEYRVEIGTILNNNKQNFLIIDRQKKKDGQNAERKYYKYRCNKCGNEDWMIEDSLLKQCGCNVCGTFKKKAKLGINTIWDTDRWMIDFGVSEEDAKRYTNRSGKKITVKCPICKKNKQIMIKRIYERKSIGCECRSSKSYPEKFVFNILRQLKVDFETEYSPKWIKPKRYDFHIKDNDYIIETHGRQHYEGSTFNYCGGKTLKQEQTNDKYKKEIALQNGIKHYITLDCRESSLDWIKNSILNSELVKLFDLSNINWQQASNYAIENTTKQICDEWNSKKEYETVEDISRKIMLSRSTIIRHLKLGTSMGLCIYDANLERTKISIKNNKKSKEKSFCF